MSSLRISSMEIFFFAICFILQLFQRLALAQYKNWRSLDVRSAYVQIDPYPNRSYNQA